MTSETTYDFKKLTDDLLFRIRSFQTDPTTRRFLQKYVPLLASKPKGGWTTYPSIKDATPEITACHSLSFSNHPFVDIDINEGQLHILTRERDEEVVNYSTYYVSFNFNNKKEAEQLFDKLCSMFTSISTFKKIVEKDLKKVAIFRNKPSESLAKEMLQSLDDEVQILLTKNEMFIYKYKVLFGEVLAEDFPEQF